MSETAPYAVHHGDALEVLPALAAESVDLAFTSPPYFNARAQTELEARAAQGRLW